MDLTLAADYSPPSNAKVKNDAAVIPLPHVFMAWCLIKHRNDFTLTLSLLDEYSPVLHTLYFSRFILILFS
jgi:hypothetical protein